VVEGKDQHIRQGGHGNKIVYVEVSITTACLLSAASSW
jgi:hypothetical protein